MPINLTATLKKNPNAVIGEAYTSTFVKSNVEMHSQPFDDLASGTTAITVLFDGLDMHIANVGDSRAVLANVNEQGKLVAVPLSSDQTPYRKDERERVKRAGGRVMSVDQLQGEAPMHED